MEKHHIVQDKYLIQWKINNTANNLHVYIIPENKCSILNTKSKPFWRKNFNVLIENKKISYLPEKITNIIDTNGLEAIRKIDAKQKLQLDGAGRSCLSFYIALQYIRTPRYREELNKMVAAQTKYLLGVSEDTIAKQILKSIDDHNMEIGLSKTGHSKLILKVERLARGLFECGWIFLIAPQNTSFITSDNPCFTVGPKIMNGLLSPKSMVFFPLRPDICICIKPITKTHVESFMSLDKKKVRDINSKILSNSYGCIVGKSEEHIKNLTKNFDHTKHKKSRDIAVSEKGPYVLFNLE